MTDHLNSFQSIVHQLVAMKMVIDDEMQASLLLCSYTLMSRCMRVAWVLGSLMCIRTFWYLNKVA